MKARGSKRKPSGKCIFCGEGNLSKEHFWPEWASPLLPKYPDNRHVEQLFTTQRTALVKPPDVRSRQGQSWTRKIRVVCRTCKNGWMSALENAAKPILTPLIATQPHTLTVDSIAVLSRWIALKIMISERNHPEIAVTLPEDHARFRSTLEIPPDFRIWIAQCGTGGWETGYIRHAATVSKSPIVTPDHRFRNIHSVAFGIGDLFVWVIQTTVPGTLNSGSITPELLVPLFPVLGPVNWPPARCLYPAEATRFAGRLDREFENLRWVPGVP
jgi:hypothetical protein